MPEALEAEIRQLYDDWIANPSAVVCARLADRLRIAGRPLEAIDVAGRGLSDWPANTSIRVVLGRCHRDAGNALEAREAFEKVLESDPINLIALRGLAEIALADGRFAEATRLFGDYLFENPADTEAEKLLQEAKAGGASAPAQPAAIVIPEASPPPAEPPAAPPEVPQEQSDTPATEPVGSPGSDQAPQATVEQLADADVPPAEEPSPEAPASETISQEALAPEVTAPGMPPAEMPAPEVPASEEPSVQEPGPEEPTVEMPAPEAPTIDVPVPEIPLPEAPGAEPVAAVQAEAPAPVIEEKPFWPQPEPLPAPSPQMGEPGPGPVAGNVEEPVPEPQVVVPPELPAEAPAEVPSGPSDGTSAVIQAPTWPEIPPEPRVEQQAPPAVREAAAEAAGSAEAGASISLDALFGIQRDQHEPASADIPAKPEERPSTPASALLEAFGIKTELPAAAVPEAPAGQYPPTSRMDRVFQEQGIPQAPPAALRAAPPAEPPAPAAPVPPRAEARPQPEKPAAAPSAPRPQGRRDPRSLLDLFGAEEREDLGLEPYRQEEA
jgi:hypothetical protein